MKKNHLFKSSMICMPIIQDFQTYMDWFVFVWLWRLMQLSTIFQLYRGCLFYCCRKPEYSENTTGLAQVTEYSENTTGLAQVTDTFITCINYTSPWAGFELTTSVVIGIDCICSCKSNYHTIIITTAPQYT